MAPAPGPTARVFRGASKRSGSGRRSGGLGGKKRRAKSDARANHGHPMA